jgi:hypothetical protein
MALKLRLIKEMSVFTGIMLAALVLPMSAQTSPAQPLDPTANAPGSPAPS